MEVYLYRHGIAAERDSGDFSEEERPLTEEGQALVQAAVPGIEAVCKGIPDIILTSPLLRARRTAEIVATALGFPRRLKVLKTLEPSVSEVALLKSLAAYGKRKKIMLVGHEPNLSNFSALLLQTRHACLRLKKGGLCRIDIDAITTPHPGELKFLLTQKQLIAQGKKKNSKKSPSR